MCLTKQNAASWYSKGKGIAGIRRGILSPFLIYFRDNGIGPRSMMIRAINNIGADLLTSATANEIRVWTSDVD